MPELPEVETIRQKLIPHILNKKISHIQVRRFDLRIPLPQEVLNFVNATVIRIHRRSKYLLIDGSHGQTLLIHLGMSGRLFFCDPELSFDKHDHVCFDFSEKKHLRFRDPRRFGLITCCDSQHLNEHPLLRHLGPEPLENSFNHKWLYQMCQTSQAPIKNVVMNAKNVVGVGNIYACESLFLAKIHPQRPAKTLTPQDTKRLASAIKKVLEESVKMGGTTFRDFVDANQMPGLHQVNLTVYGCENRPCKKCDTKIKRIILAGRSSFFCPTCQSL